jgi:quercetin dioxygenase-like cupin family protein
MGSHLEALLITMASGGVSGGRLHARETELFAFVFAGDVWLELDDNSQLLLQRGDAITIPSGTLHRWENRSASAVQLLKIMAR